MNDIFVVGANSKREAISDRTEIRANMIIAALLLIEVRPYRHPRGSIAQLGSNDLLRWLSPW